MTRAMPSSAAIQAAKSGPLPPKASSAAWRGSRPRSTETARMARIMFADAMRSIPQAACSTQIPIGAARSRAIAARAAAASSRSAPPTSPAGSR